MPPGHGRPCAISAGMAPDLRIDPVRRSRGPSERGCAGCAHPRSGVDEAPATPRFPATKPPSYGVVTQGAVALVEAESPHVLRSYCLASSTTEFPSRRPSTWSGALDQIAAGRCPRRRGWHAGFGRAEAAARSCRDGNVAGGMMVDVAPSQSLEDPSQSWNALSIGGFTRKEEIPAHHPRSSQSYRPTTTAVRFGRGSQSLTRRPDADQTGGVVRGRQHVGRMR